MDQQRHGTASARLQVGEMSPFAEGAIISSPVELAVVVPTFNERANIPELVARLESVLTGISWELLFVDDDSPDGTSALVSQYAQRDRRIRLVHRIGRRGLSSACIEGMLATSAPCVAVMDADLQHDESILPQMLVRLRSESLDLVVATRNAEGGAMGQFSRDRQRISMTGRKISQAVCKCRLSDPMSGFFLLQRSFFLEVVHGLHGGGFKILVDMLSSAERPVRLAEIGYTFRPRRRGASKLDVSVAIEYLFLIIDKLTGRLVPTRFAAFSLVGAAGVVTHFLFVFLFMFGLHWRFGAAQVAATYIAMTENFFLNNLITWRDRRLQGVRLLSGLVSFCVACSFGAWANVVFARSLLAQGAPWYLAGVAGVVLSSVWNYSVASLFTWQTAVRNTGLAPEADAAPLPLEEAVASYSEH